ncbi:putative ribonuclease H-like domain-containing protein [Tanacetum coccineum]
MCGRREIFITYLLPEVRAYGHLNGPGWLSSRPTTLVEDKTVHEERGDNVEKAATTATSLDAEQGSGGSPRCQEAMGDTIAQTRSERVSIPSYDSPLLRVNTLGSDGERIKLKELMEKCTKLFDRVLDLENVKDAQALEIKKLKKRVKKLENKKNSRTLQLKRRLFKVRIESSAEKSLGDQEDASKQGRNEIDQDEGISCFQEDAKTQGRYGYDTKINTASTSITTASINITTVEHVITASAPIATVGVLLVPQQRPIVPPQQQLDPKDKGKGIMQEPKKPVKVKGKDQIEYDADMASNAALIEEWDTIEARIDVDAQLAKRLQAKEREQMHVKERARLLMEFITARKKFFAAKRAEEQRKKPPTKAEQRKKMYTYMKHMARYKDKKFKGKSFDAIKQIKKKAVSKKRAGERPSEESVKKQKIEDDAEKAELKACLEIVPGDDSAVSIESLATKYLIVDCKTQILAEDKMYYQIIRADGSTKYYKIFSAMLDDFDRQDVLDLYSTVEVTAASYEVTTAVYVSTAGVD